MSVYAVCVTAAELIGVVPSSPDDVPRNTLYVTPPVGLAVHDSATQCAPVPVRVITAGELVALLATLTFAPLTAPPDVGANVTVNVVDCPAVNTVPPGTPLALKPAPVAVTPEIVTLEFPLFVSDVVLELVVSSVTLPKARLVGFEPSKSDAV